MSIRVEHLSKWYGKTKAVDDVSFNVEAGEIVGFLGPNGAGKSTVMKILTGYLPSGSGQAFINDLNVASDHMEVSKAVGYLPEHNPLYDNMYVREYLTFIARLFELKHPRSVVDNLIERVGLENHAHKKIMNLSKGFRQRVGLAQALINDPDVLILDEPISGLDPNQLVEIRTLIKAFGGKKAVLFSSHIMQEVEAVADRLLIIHQGKLVADGSVEQLRGKLSGRSSVVLECHAPVSTDEFIDIEGVTGAESLDGYSIRIFYTSERDITKEVFDRVVEISNSIRALRHEQATVEEVFRLITQN